VHRGPPHPDLSKTLAWIWLGVLLTIALVWWIRKLWRKHHPPPPPEPALNYSRRLQLRLQKRRASARARQRDLRSKAGKRKGGSKGQPPGVDS
jgi:hypothetical protein